jgi:hypothetical protein
MMEAVQTSDKLVNLYHCTWRYNPEDSHLRTMVMSIRRLGNEEDASYIMCDVLQLILYRLCN